MYIYIYIYIVQSTDTCFISVAWYNLDMAWQLFIPKRLSVRTACGTIAVMRTSRERKAIWGQSAQTTTRVVGFALLRKDTHTNFTECSTTPKWRSVIVQSTDTCFTVPQLISVAWYNLDIKLFASNCVYIYIYFIIYYILHITYHISHITYHISHLTYYILYIIW